jgi:hypothetical protein
MGGECELSRPCCTMNVGHASMTVHSGSLNDNERNHFKKGFFYFRSGKQKFEGHTI